MKAPLSVVSGACLLLSLWLLAVPGCASTLDMQRLDFLHAEHVMAGKDNAAFLEALEKISDYPLYSYLKSKWLKENLDQTEQIKAFLSRYPDSRFANQLRAKWLPVLSGQQQWHAVLTYFRESDGIENQCLYNQARFVTGKTTEALTAVKGLWLLGEDLPNECNFIVAEFKKSQGYSQDLVWQRFDKALQRNRISLAQYLKGTMDRTAQNVAAFWLQLYNKPELIQSATFSNIPAKHQGAMFAFAVQRLMRKAPLDAIALWDGRPAEIHIEAARALQIEQKLALALANNKLPGAYGRLMQVADADDDIKEWRVRAALIDGNWANVAKAVASLSAADQNKAKWQYWQARADWQLGNKAQAERLFKQLSVKADYYGFLSADYLNTDYTFDDKPAQVLPQLKAQLLTSDDVKIVQELRHHHRDHEAQKQWWHLIKRLDAEGIKAAAKIAQDWQWQQMAIFTLAKSDYWDDMTLRFPIAFQDSVLENATNQALDPMIIFGLIRQESAFDQVAFSPVGARGLMQIMPATGVQIARELKEPWGSASSLFDPLVNIKYGTYYYKKMLQRFNGHFALAAAAYNAGPHRVAKWLPSNESMAADVWIETIPFKETRRYVAAVLSYAMIYQQRLQREGLKMRDLMREVAQF